MKVNRFGGVEDVESLLGQMVGAGSMCWERVGCAGEFDSSQASDIVDEGLARLSQLIGPS